MRSVAVTWFSGEVLLVIRLSSQITDTASVRDFDVGRQSVDHSLLQQRRDSFMPDVSQDYYTQYVIVFIPFLVFILLTTMASTYRYDYGMEDNTIASKSRDSTALAVTSVIIPYLPREGVRIY